MDKQLIELAAKVEAASGPDRELDAVIAFRLFSASAELGLNAPRYTASLDAAMTLAEAPDRIIREAVSALAKRFDLHISTWPKGEDYTQWLARFVAAASLRVIASKETQS